MTAMKKLSLAAGLVGLGALAWVSEAQQAGNSAMGLFSEHQDIGTTPKTGTTEYDAAKGIYRVTGGGANIWGKADAFQFVYTKISGDVTFTADISFEGKGVEEHRKAALMIRQSLDPDAAYADVAVHGAGLTSLQYRESGGAETKELRSDLNGPVRVRIERHGNQFTMAAGSPGGDLKPSGPVTVALSEPVYVGLAVSAHNANVLETADFSNVTITRGEQPARQGAAAKNAVKKTNVSVYDLVSKSVKVISAVDGLAEAPNWSPDGKYLLINAHGDLLTMPVEGESHEMQKIDLGGIARCNNDKGYSPDGKLIAFSSGATGQGSQVYTVPATGGTAKMLVSETPSYFHAFSPDGKWLAIVAQRDKNFDLFRLPVGGGAQQRLTSSPGYDDGPDYSPDGKWIYFNSNRSGKWDIWRMPAEGAGPEDSKAQRVTDDEQENWFPHCSPDGKWLVFVTFPKGTETHNDHLNVSLRMIALPGKKIEPATVQTLAEFFGGQGTINVNSWAPDSSKFAFVSYEQ